MINKCTSLKSLDISYFDFGKISNLESISSLLENLLDIQYLNISNVENYDTLKNIISENTNFNTKNDLTVCQSEEIINNENATYICRIPKHNSTNYIII